MKILKKLFEGKRGEIYLVQKDEKIFVMKKKKADSPDFIKKEYEILKKLSNKYSPKVFEKGKDFLLMEYLKGYSFKEALIIDEKKSILLACELCYYLDKQKIYHSQLGRYYHLIVSTDFKSIKVLDFERAKINSKQKNLLQFIGYYLKDKVNELKEDIEIYKKDIDKGYIRIVDTIFRMVDSK